MFTFGSLLSIVMVLIYTHMGTSTLPIVILVNTVMFVGIFSRMIPSQVLMSAIPEASMRGSFMSVSSSLQSIAGGCASVVAGMIVVQRADGFVEHFDTLGYIMVGTALVALLMMTLINRAVSRKLAAAPVPTPVPTDVPSH